MAGGEPAWGRGAKAPAREPNVARKGGRRRWARLERLLGEGALGVLLAGVLMLAPLGWLGPLVGAVQMPLAVFFLVCFIGKLLYDTLFYDHYWP